jgi:hypothetical protein
VTCTAAPPEPAGKTSKLLRHMVFGNRSVRTLIPLVRLQIHGRIPDAAVGNIPAHGAPPTGLGIRPRRLPAVRAVAPDLHSRILMHAIAPPAAAAKGDPPCQAPTTPW